MSILTEGEAQRQLPGLLDAVADSHEPVLITGQRHNGVLVSEDDWRAVQETLHLAQIPGMVESIKEAKATPAAEMSEDAGW